MPEGRPQARGRPAVVTGGGGARIGGGGGARIGMSRPRALPARARALAQDDGRVLVFEKHDNQGMECVIKSVSRSPDRRRLLIGGADCLKLVNLEEDRIRPSMDSGFTQTVKDEAGVKVFKPLEWRDVRSGRKRNANFAVQDLKWHPRDQGLVASAAANGSIARPPSPPPPPS